MTHLVKRHAWIIHNKIYFQLSVDYIRGLFTNYPVICGKLEPAGNFRGSRGLKSFAARRAARLDRRNLQNLRNIKSEKSERYMDIYI